MASNGIEDVWKEGEACEASPAPLSGKDLQGIISSSVRKELKTVIQLILTAI
jgi:hypothetical protein